MNIIITGMEMPESCANCPICHCKGKDDPWNYYCDGTMDDINIEEWDRERYITCPLKSIDGLIEFIKVHTYPVRYDKNSLEQGMTITGIEQAIKEYCEVT